MGKKINIILTVKVFALLYFFDLILNEVDKDGKTNLYYRR